MIFMPRISVKISTKKTKIKKKTKNEILVYLLYLYIL